MIQVSRNDLIAKKAVAWLVNGIKSRVMEVAIVISTIFTLIYSAITYPFRLYFFKKNMKIATLRNLPQDFIKLSESKPKAKPVTSPLISNKIAVLEKKDSQNSSTATALSERTISPEPAINPGEEDPPSLPVDGLVENDLPDQLSDNQSTTTNLSDRPVSPNEPTINSDEEGLPLNPIPVALPEQVSPTNSPPPSPRLLFLTNEKHTAELTLEDRENLITRGQNILQSLLNDKPVEENNSPIFSSEKIKSLSSSLSETIGKVCSAPYSAARQTGIISSADPNHTKKRQMMLEDIISLVWAIYYEAHSRGDLIEGGSFIIRDPQHLKIWNYLEKYVLFATETDQIKNLPSSWGSNFAYNRTGYAWWGGLLSSHLHKNTIIQLGIDIRFESNGWTFPLLPFQHRHLLIGIILYENEEIVNKTNKDKTPINELSKEYKTALFMKAEHAGLGDMSSLTAHAFSFLIHKTSARSEKILPKEFLEAAAVLWKQISDSEMPKQIYQMVAILLKMLNEQPPPHESKHDAIRNLLKLIDSSFGSEDLDVRRGNEVIIHQFLAGNPDLPK